MSQADIHSSNSTASGRWRKRGETIWQVAKRQGREIPHLCYSPEPDYRPDGNCRACMVEIEGERVLAASCKRTPSVGMKVKSASPRATAAQKMVMELLVADQPARETSHDPDSKFWHWAEKVEVTESRFPAAERWQGDASHPAMRVNLDACIQCGLCVRACREVQVNDVIGMAYRNHDSKIVFDFDDPMGESTCVACGECVQACPTGALMPAVMLDENQTRTVYADKKVEFAVPVLRRRLPGHLSGQGREGHLCRRPRWPGQSQPALRQGPLRLRLHPSSASPDKAAGAAAECEEGCQRPGRSGQSVHAFPRSVVGGSPRYRRQGAGENPRREGRQGAGRFRLGQGLQRRGLSVPEAGAHRFRLQQCRSLHAAVPRLVGRGVDGRPQFRRGVGAVRGRHGCRSHHRDRRQSDGQPSGRRDLSSRTPPSAAPS